MGKNIVLSRFAIFAKRERIEEGDAYPSPSPSQEWGGEKN
jgi:hypothetical protein